MTPVYDLAVIGGGVMGLFTAYYGATPGKKVVILERSRVGDPQTASFGLTRSIRNDYLDPLYAKLAFAARQLWLELQAQTPERFLIECGCLNLAKADITPALEDTYAEQSHQVLTGLHLRTQSFTRQGLQSRYPQFDADLGRLDVEAGVLYLPVITQTLLAALHRRGVAIEERSIVEAITAHGREVHIQTNLGERRARSLVVAAGIGTNAVLDRIDGCALQFPILQDRPSQTKYFIPPDNQRDLFVAGTLPVFAYLDVGVYGHPILEGRTPGVKIGYYNPPDVQRIKTRIASVEAFVEECMPALRGARSVDVKEVDQCSYDLISDDNFILGLLPGFQNIAVGVGWRGTGYKFAPLIGRTLAELALKGRSEHAINRFSPARFVSADVG